MSSGQLQARHPSTKGQRIFVAATILVFAAVSAYLALVIVTRVDSIFFPGEIKLTALPGGETIAPKLPGVDAEGASANQDRVNILVVGLDRGPRDGDVPSRTDTVFVVTVDPKTKSSSILGIPRDLIVEIPGVSDGDRINTVYERGELEDYPGGGVALLKDVFDQNFEIKIDKYVIVDFEGFEEIIDGIGGIDVDVPEEVYDPYFSFTELPGDYDPQYFEVGRQHMDGKEALAYARIRFSGDDFDRIQRQQRVIFAAIEKAESLNWLNVKKMVDLWGQYKDTVDTDVNDLLIGRYAGLANDVKNNMHAVSLGPATIPYTTRQGAQVLLGDWDAIHEIVESMFTDAPASFVASATSTPEPAVRVEVQNGTGEDGLATRVVTYIATKGYPLEDLVSANTFDGSQHAVSEIIDLDGTHEQNRLLLSRWLGIDPENVRAASPAERERLGATTADIIVILGSDVDFAELIQSPTTATPGG